MIAYLMNVIVPGSPEDPGEYNPLGNETYRGDRYPAGWASTQQSSVWYLDPEHRGVAYVRIFWGGTMALMYACEPDGRRIPRLAISRVLDLPRATDAALLLSLGYILDTSYYEEHIRKSISEEEPSRDHESRT